MGQVELENAEVSTFLHYMDIYLESASYCITLLLSFYFSFVEIPVYRYNFLWYNNSIMQGERNTTSWLH